MFNKILLLLGCIALLFFSWTAVFAMESPLDKQTALIALAEAEINKGTYANAEPFLEEAVTYNTPHTFAAMESLKTVYFALNYPQKYLKILKEQTARTDCPAAVYEEYARYLIAQGKLFDALTLLKQGIERTHDEGLTALYEEQRYAYTLGSEIYEEVTAYHSGGIQVKRGGLWGLANTAGRLMIPCEYDQISTYDSANKGRVIAVQNGKGIIAVNTKNQVVAKTDITAQKIGNLSQDIVPLQIENGKWIIANSQLISNQKEYDYLGTVANSAVALQSGNQWGVMTLSGDVLLPYEYDEILMDEIGRCYAQEAVFARKDGKVYLFTNGTAQSETYEDARPFSANGWAAVKKSGQWGFVDPQGAVKIDYQFDDALSFGQHVAAVKVGDLWGYISQSGKVVIAPAFAQAKSFSGGHAPVLTERGWQFISLVEYSK